MRTLLLLLAFVGCRSGSQGISGTWEGTCDLEDEHYDIVLAILDEDGDVSGEAEVLPSWMIEPVLGPVTGSHKEAKVSLAADVGDVAVGFVLTLDAKYDGADAMAGDCATDAVSGTGELTRTSDALPSDPQDTAGTEG